MWESLADSEKRKAGVVGYSKGREKLQKTTLERKPCSDGTGMCKL